MDAEDTFKKIFENGQYASILEQYKNASAEEQGLAKKYFSEITDQDDFGDMFYTSQTEAELGWTECDEDQKDAIAKFMRDYMLPEDE